MWRPTAAIGVDAGGRPRGILGDDETMTVLGDFPLRTLTAFPGLGIDQQVAAALLDHSATPGAAPGGPVPGPGRAAPS